MKLVKKKEITTKTKKNKNITSLAFLKNKSNLDQFFTLIQAFLKQVRLDSQPFLSSKMKQYLVKPMK